MPQIIPVVGYSVRERQHHRSHQLHNVRGKTIGLSQTIPFSSFQSYDRLDRRGDMTDDSAEILFQFFFFSAGGHCKQCWHEQRRPLFDVVHPTCLLPATASLTLQGILKDGFGKAVVAPRQPSETASTAQYYRKTIPQVISIA